MKAALHVCTWYLLEFQRLFGRIGELSDEGKPTHECLRNGYGLASK